MTYGIVLLTACYLIANTILTSAVLMDFKGGTGARIGICVVGELLAVPILILILIFYVPYYVLTHDKGEIHGKD